MNKTYPQPVVGAFIINQQKQILLTKSYKWAKGKLWSIPGGRIEMGELIKQAVEREAWEEVGLKVKFVKAFAVFDAINPKNFYRAHHFIFLECLCKTNDLNFELDHREIQEAQWFNLQNIDFSKIEPNAVKAIKELNKAIRKDL